MEGVFLCSIHQSTQEKIMAISKSLSVGPESKFKPTHLSSNRQGDTGNS